MKPPPMMIAAEARIMIQVISLSNQRLLATARGIRHSIGPKERRLRSLSLRLLSGRVHAKDWGHVWRFAGLGEGGDVGFGFGGH